MSEPNRFERELREANAAHRSAGLRRYRTESVSMTGGRCLRNGREFFDFASNDYLGLAGDVRVVEACREATAEYGVGSRASALVTGRSKPQAELERRLSEFEGTEAALVFPTGFAANLGTIAALVGAGDVVFCDRDNHASLIDGCRLSGASLRVYRRDRLDRLEHHLQRFATASRRLIVTDAVFSMDGVTAPLPELCHIADRTDSVLVVDEAHGTGVYGDGGRGWSDECDVADRIPVRLGTLSKAAGALGGFVCGSAALVERLEQTARTQFFSTAPPPAVCAAALAALRIIETEPARRQRLHSLADRLRSGLKAGGHDLAGSTRGPIVPVLVGEPGKTVLLGNFLAERGLLVGVIRPPTVPQGTSRLRISISAAHDETAVDQLIDAVNDWSG